MSAAADSQPDRAVQLLAEHVASLEAKPDGRPPAYARLERAVGRHLATVLVRGLARRLR